MFNSCIRITSAAVFALVNVISAGSAIAAIPLGVAQSFGVLGGATVTNTGPTIVNGDVGVSPGAAVVGFPPGTVSMGTIHAADAVAAQAQSDLTVAYNAAAGLPCNTDLTGQNLGGLTLTPGVYCFNTSAQLTGTLTLDVQGNPNAQFVFKIGSTLTTASGSVVATINGSSCDKIYWQVGTSATLGTGSTFAGDILALASITMTTGSNTAGRALARNAAVTLDSNNVNTCAQAAAPTLTTIASPSILLGGGQLTDSATVSGRTNPTAGASITFRLYGPNDATCGNPPVFISAAVPYPIAGGPVTSAGFTPAVVGTYRWIASYSGDANNPPIIGVCNAPNESAIVSIGALAAPTLATTASPNVVLGATISDSATVSGRVNPVAGATVTFSLYGPNDATCTGPAIFISAVNYPIAGGAVSSPPFTPTLPGTYRWIASYSGDANNAAVTAACNAPNESVIVSAAVLPIPTITTTASPNIVLGGSLTDSATVSGRTNPTAGASITFRLYGPNDATCGNPPVFISAAVPYPIAGGPVTSAGFIPALVGTYRWIASYSGDANNPPIIGVCNAPNESAIVSIGALGAPTLATTASPNVVLGATISDSATVSGRVNPVAGATVTFSLYGPNDATCTGPAIFISAVNYPIAGGPVSSLPFTPTLPGTYRWIASYSGDANNAAVTAACNAPNESVIVSAAVLPIPTIATTASPNIFLGGSLTDNATVSGRVNPVAGATVTFQLYSAGDPTCAGAPIFASIVAYPAAGGSVTSTAFTPASPGTYRWIASYSGDANNGPVAAPCNAPNENVVVSAVATAALPIPTLSTSLLLVLIAALSVLGWKAARRSS